MCKTALLLICLASACHGRRLQSFKPQVEKSWATPVVSNQEYAALAKLLLASASPEAAFNAFGAGARLPMRNAAVARRGDVRNQEGVQFDYAPMDEEQARIVKEQEDLDERSERYCEIIPKDARIWLIGAGNRVNMFGHYMGNRYLKRSTYSVKDLIVDNFPKVYKDMVFENDTATLQECLLTPDGEAKVLAMASGIIKQIQEQGQPGTVISTWDQLMPSDWEVFKRDNDVVVEYIPWECDFEDWEMAKSMDFPEGVETNEEKTAYRERCRKTHEKADITLRADTIYPRLPEKDLTWRPDQEGIDLLEALVNFYGGMPDSDKRDGLAKMKKSDLRKRAQAAGADEDAIDDADDSDNAKEAFIDLILELEGTTSGGGSDIRRELELLKKSVLRKRAVTAGASEDDLDDADDAEDPKEAMIELVMKLEGK